MKFVILVISLLSAGVLDASRPSQNTTSSSSQLTSIINSLLPWYPLIVRPYSTPVARDFQNIFRSASASVDSIRPAVDDAVVIRAIVEPFTPSTGLDRSASNLGAIALRRSSSKLKTKVRNFLKKPFRALGWSSRDEESESLFDDFVEALVPDFRVLNESITNEMTNQIQGYFTTFRNTIESRLENLNLERSSTGFRSSAMEREAAALDILYRTFRRPEELASSLARWISQTAATGRDAFDESAARSSSRQRDTIIDYEEHYGFESHREKPLRQFLRNGIDSVRISTDIARAGVSDFFNRLSAKVGLGRDADRTAVRNVRMTEEADEKEMPSNNKQVTLEKKVSNEGQDQKLPNENQDEKLPEKV